MYSTTLRRSSGLSALGCGLAGGVAASFILKTPSQSVMTKAPTTVTQPDMKRRAALAFSPIPEEERIKICTKEIARLEKLLHDETLWYEQRIKEYNKDCGVTHTGDMGRWNACVATDKYLDTCADRLRGYQDNIKRLRDSLAAPQP